MSATIRYNHILNHGDAHAISIEPDGHVTIEGNLIVPLDSPWARIVLASHRLICRVRRLFRLGTKGLTLLAMVGVRHGEAHQSESDVSSPS